MHIEEEKIVELLFSAEDVIMEVYGKNAEDVEKWDKNDKSPLTEADLKSSKIICDGLREWAGGDGIICEEEKDVEWDNRKNWEWVWLVDPLDGTKEFLKRNGQFTTNIGLVRRGECWAGFVGVPCESVVYSAIKGRGVVKWYKDGRCEEITKCARDTSVVRVVASNSHMNEATENFIKGIKEKVELVNVGSSLKFLWIVEGKADVYPRIAPTMEWDTCAAQCILEEYGGKCIIFGKKCSVVYNKQNLLNPFFIASV